MSKFINFFIKLFIFIISFLFATLIVLIVGTYIFSQQSDTPIQDTLAEFQVIGKEIIDSKLTNKNSISISLDDTTSAQTPIISTDTKYKYYYYQLDSYGKTIYTNLENNIDNLKKENYIIDFSTQFNDLLNKTNGQDILNKSFQSALDAFAYDYPELFYIDISKMTLTIKSTSIGPLTTYKVSLSPLDNKNYLTKAFSSENEVDKAILKVENIRTNAINNLTDINDYNKILSVHDSLVNSLEYDTTLNKINTHNMYGALVEKNVVCEGYAKSFKYLLDALNIKNILVSGIATNSSNESESHMWNYVELNGKWYGVDVTWDDPIIIGGPSKNSLRHTYFLKGNSTFNKSHVTTGKISDEGIIYKLPSLSLENYK